MCALLFGLRYTTLPDVSTDPGLYDDPDNGTITQKLAVSEDPGNTGLYDEPAFQSSTFYFPPHKTCHAARGVGCGCVARAACVTCNACHATHAGTDDMETSTDQPDPMYAPVPHSPLDHMQHP